MKKISFLIACVLVSISVIAQDNPPTREPINLSNRSNDHLLIQFGYTNWMNKPDSVKTSGFSKSFNVYFMFDFPFKNNPKLSMGFGPGIATDHIIFEKTFVGIKELTPTIRFTDMSDTNWFAKTKLATAFLEAPIEFRYTANPMSPGKSLKFALGVKIGTLLNAHTRNTKFEDKNGSPLNDFTMKEASKRFINKNRILGSARIGYGHFTLFGQYQFTSVFKDAAGPDVKPFSIGLTLSGL